MSYTKLEASFYQRNDVVEISRELLGKYFCTNIDGYYTAGMIVETEAYHGRNDKACHAHLNRRTKRTEIMYAPGGVAYVYLCYGIHYLFNIVTNRKELADAILVRAIEPIDGVEIMLQRRKMSKLAPKITAGPGSVSQALGISKKHYGESLLGNTLWLEDRGIIIHPDEIIASTRVGVAYAEEDALLPWRFRVKGNIYTSKAK
ncbi:MAG: DNA-3-methyladenine glycosylase [Cyclobacteriaceae bacterium]